LKTKAILISGQAMNSNNPQSAIERAHYYNQEGINIAEKGNIKKAKKFYKRALFYSPDFREASLNLSIANLLLGEREKAIKGFDEVIGSNPTNVTLLNQIGIRLGELKYFADAKRYFKRALKVDKRNLMSFINLADNYFLQGHVKGNIQKAEINYRKALKIDPKNISARFKLGMLYKDTKFFKDAAREFKKAQKLSPGNVDILIQLRYCLSVIGKFRMAEKLGKEIDHLDITADTPFGNISRMDDPEKNLRVAKTWADKIGVSVKSQEKFTFDKKKLSKKKKIRIAYISSDFQQKHPIAHLVKDFFSSHDRKRFEVYAYTFENTFTKKKNPLGCQIINGFDKHKDITNLTYRQTADLIKKDSIDILVDLKGFTESARPQIFAYRPAPIQITYLGFPGSTGADFFDYTIADKILVPEIMSMFYSEKIIYMPDCYQINSPRIVSSKKFTKKSQKLPANKFVFVSFNSPIKINSITFKAWMKILRNVPDSILWLHNHNKYLKPILKRQAKKERINPNRLIFSDYLPFNEHLKRQELADLALDTIGYSGGATTSHALWMGIPVITQPKRNYISRMSSSLVTVAGIPEMVVRSEKEYVDLAVKLANSPKLLNQIHKSLISNRESSPLFDVNKFLKNLEKGYKIIWKRYLTGKKPKNILLKNPNSNV